MTTGRINQVTTLKAVRPTAQWQQGYYRMRRIAAGATSASKGSNCPHQIKTSFGPLGRLPQSRGLRQTAQGRPSRELPRSGTKGSTTGADSQMFWQNSGQRPSIHRFPTFWAASRRPRPQSVLHRVADRLMQASVLGRAMPTESILSFA
jgi:hypothetical protein